MEAVILCVIACMLGFIGDDIKAIKQILETPATTHQPDVREETP